MMPGLSPVNQQVESTKLVNPPLENQKLSSKLSNQSVDGRWAETAPAFGEPLPKRVRQLPSPSAHPSNRLIAQLNRNWRVVDDPLQWILQRRKGNPRKRNSGWQDRSFCTTREGLLRCVRETCGEVDDKALAHLRALPEFHPGELSR
jgi:hypothetical protein